MNVDSLKLALDGISEEYKNILIRDNKQLISEVIKKINLVIKDAAKLAPPSALIFNAFKLCKAENLKVVIIGQDPYPGVGDACGLAFSVSKDNKKKLPGSLKNIYGCLYHNKLVEKIPLHGSLENWAKQGVLLLNTALTTEVGKANAHTFWNTYTDHIISSISNKFPSLIFMLWGLPAQKKADLIDKTKHTVLFWNHPSPINTVNSDDANLKNFKYCDHFIKCNELLIKNNLTPINWDPDLITILMVEAKPIVAEAKPIVAEVKPIVTEVKPIVAEVYIDNLPDIEFTQSMIANVTEPEPEPKPELEPEPKVEQAMEQAIGEETEPVTQTLVIAADGASKANGKPTCVATYGYIVTASDDATSLKEGCGEVPPVTIPGKKYKSSNNRGELMAIQKGIEAADEINDTSDLIIISDSEYSIKTLTIWGPEWVEKNKTVGKENLDLILPLLETLNQIRLVGRKVTFKHINSHQEAPEDEESDEYFDWYLNDCADKLAAQGFTLKK